MDRAVAAARTGDLSGLEAVFEEESDRRLAPAGPQADRAFVGAPPAPIVEVSYKATPVAVGAVRDQGFRVSSPFAGGALDLDGFGASIYVATGAPAPQLTTLVVVCQPELSHFERRAVDTLSREMNDIPDGEQEREVPPLVRLRRGLVLSGWDR
jgi:hypothetical protein